MKGDAFVSKGEEGHRVSSETVGGNPHLWSDLSSNRPGKRWQSECTGCCGDIRHSQGSLALNRGVRAGHHDLVRYHTDTGQLFELGYGGSIWIRIFCDI